MLNKTLAAVDAISEDQKGPGVDGAAQQFTPLTVDEVPAPCPARVTTIHLASHKIGCLWRLHAVHHSIRRFYGLNGLMKHPLHQAVEMLGGVLPLIAMGIPVQVASALAVCVAVQLLLQHANVDYRVGPLRSVLALNEGHRFHHLKWPGVGDVNFGLFTLLWDHLDHVAWLDDRKWAYVRRRADVDVLVLDLAGQRATARIPLIHNADSRPKISAWRPSPTIRPPIYGNSPNPSLRAERATSTRARPVNSPPAARRGHEARLSHH